RMECPMSNFELPMSEGVCVGHSTFQPLNSSTSLPIYPPPIHSFTHSLILLHNARPMAPLSSILQPFNPSSFILPHRDRQASHNHHQQQPRRRHGDLVADGIG